MYRILIVIFLGFISPIVNSATGYINAKIKYIRVHDKEAHTSAWAPPIFRITLDTTASAGDCGKWNGDISFVMDSEMAYSMALGAFMAGKEVSIRYDDSLRALSNNWCKGTMITIGNPPPSN